MHHDCGFRVWAILWLLWPLAVVAQSSGRFQSADAVSLRIRLRYDDGTAVVGEPVTLQRLPEETVVSPDCVTDDDGSCVWWVGRGVYQVLFSRPLDELSALAVAEGGLRGLGVTVGDAPIIYHFTFHEDDRVYFDAAPDAAVPAPIIPIADARHGGVLSPQEIPTAPTPLISPTTAPDTAVTFAAPGNFWRLALFVAGGLLLGGGYFLIFRLRPSRPSPQLSKTEHSDRRRPHA